MSLALVLGKDREKPLEVLPMAKANFIKERRERLPQGRGGPSQERHGHWNGEARGLSGKGFHIFI